LAAAPPSVLQLLSVSVSAPRSVSLLLSVLPLPSVSALRLASGRRSDSAPQSVQELLAVQWPVS
jgi:hypothetical protein